MDQMELIIACTKKCPDFLWNSAAGNCLLSQSFAKRRISEAEKRNTISLLTPAWLVPSWCEYKVNENVTKKVLFELQAHHFISFADKPDITSLEIRHL